MTVDLGRVVPINKGAYKSSETYALNHLVIWNNNLYWHVGQNETAGVDPTDTDVWLLVVDIASVYGRLNSALSSMEDEITAMRAAVGTPLTATSAEGMTDHEKIYVYVGTSTASLTNGHWYFYDGEAWADGGTYNSTALSTDTTLSVSGAAADAKVTGMYAGALRTAQKPELGLAQGGINSANGRATTTNYDYRCRSDYIQVPAFGVDVGSDSGTLRFYVFAYATAAAADYTGALTDSWVSSYHAALTAGQYIRVAIKYADDSAITPDDCEGDVVITAYAPTDETMSMKWAAADAAETGRELDSLAQSIGWIAEDVSAGLQTNRTVRANGNVLKDNDYKASELKRNASWKAIEVKANADAQAIVSLLTESIAAKASGTAAPFATGETGRHEIPAGTTLQLTLPTDCAVISVTVDSNGTDNTPEYLNSIYTGAHGPTLLDLIAGSRGEAVTGFVPIPLSAYTAFNGTVFDYGQDGDFRFGVKISGSSYKSIEIPWDSSWGEIVIKAREERSAVVSLLASSINGASDGDEVTFATGETQRHIIPRGSIGRISAEGITGIAYLCITTKSSGNDMTPEYAAAVPSGAQQPTMLTVAADLRDCIRDVPENIGVLNVICRAHQMTRAQFVTAAELPRQGDRGDQEEGVRVYGIPYSSLREEVNYVGECVSLETFFTAALNPNSYLYTRSVTTNNGKTYYGLVCSSFCDYCLGFEKTIPVSNDYPLMEDMERLENQTTYGLKLGDILWTHGHVRIVTDIWRDSRGRIKDVEICEAWSPNCREEHYSAAGIQDMLDGGYVAYRYKKIWSVPYTPSPWVHVEDETGTPTWNTVLSPRRGDKANWLADEDVEIDVTDQGDYTQYKLYKDTTLIETEDIPAGIGTADPVIVLTSLEGGKYKLCLTDGENDSGYVYFIVVDPTITWEALDTTTGRIHVTFSCGQGTVVSVAWNNGDSTSSGYKSVLDVQELTAAQIAAGEATVQKGAYKYLMRVMIRTDYGLWGSELTEVDAGTEWATNPYDEDGGDD